MSVLPLIVWLISSPVCADTTSLVRDASRTPATLRFAGDLLLASHYESEMSDSSGATFRDLYRLGGADATVVNLECPVTVRGTRVPKPFNFKMNPRFLSILTGGGIDIVSIANNHIYDFGPRGLFDTISYLDSIRVRHIGAGANSAEAHLPVIDTVRGHVVAFLAYYGGGESPGAGTSSPGVARRDLAGVCRDIRALRNGRGSSYIVIILHWGTERATEPDRGQVAFAHALIDAGADAVIGHHPHVLQGIERYGRGVIAYSLGNFIFGGNDRNSYSTGVFEIRLGSDGAHYAFIPIRVERWRASISSGADSSGCINTVKRLSSIFPRTIFTN